jgi:4'-phosphopantetheinyl transferase
MLNPVIVAIPPVAPPRSPRQVQQQRDYGRLALRHGAGLCRAPIDGWVQDEEEVPLPNAGFHWSVSHKRQWAAAVIADRPVGIDIEHIVPRARTIHEALGSDKEWRIMGDRSWLAFFRLWTAKEATLKANGRGIGELTRCRVVDVRDGRHLTMEYCGQRWPIAQFFHASHVTSVTRFDEDVNWCVLEENPQGCNVERSVLRDIQPCAPEPQKEPAP